MLHRFWELYCWETHQHVIMFVLSDISWVQHRCSGKDLFRSFLVMSWQEFSQAWTSVLMNFIEFPSTSISSLQMHLGCPGYFVWNRATCSCRCYGSGVTLPVWGSNESNGWESKWQDASSFRGLSSLRPSAWLHGRSFSMVLVPNTSSSACIMTV